MKITRWWFYLIAVIISFLDLSWELLFSYSGVFETIAIIGLLVTAIGSIAMTYAKPGKNCWSIKDVLFSGLILYFIREVNFFIFAFSGFTGWIIRSFLPEISDLAGNAGGIFTVLVKMFYLAGIFLHVIIWGTVLILVRFFREPKYKEIIKDFPGKYRIVRLKSGRDVLVRAKKEALYRYTGLIGRESVNAYKVIGTVVAIRTSPNHRKAEQDLFNYYLLDTVNNTVRILGNENEYGAEIRQAMWNEREQCDK